jgi:hypothetical protein
MSYSAIIASIDEELSNLQQVRKLLAQSGKLGSTKELLAATKAATKTATKAAKKTSKRTLSPEARARIAAAQKKRWAAVKKAKK